MKPATPCRCRCCCGPVTNHSRTLQADAWLGLPSHQQPVRSPVSHQACVPERRGSHRRLPDVCSYVQHEPPIPAGRPERASSAGCSAGPCFQGRRSLAACSRRVPRQVGRLLGRWAPPRQLGRLSAGDRLNLRSVRRSVRDEEGWSWYREIGAGPMSNGQVS